MMFIRKISLISRGFLARVPQPYVMKGNLSNVKEQLFINKTDNISIQFIRYTIVGGVAFAFDFGSLVILTEFLKVYYLVSAAIAFSVGLTVNYILSISWVFKTRSIDTEWIEFIVFLLIGIVGLGLNELFIWFFTDIAHIHYLVSKIISTGFVYVWNFLARKYTLFS